MAYQDRSQGIGFIYFDPSERKHNPRFRETTSNVYINRYGFSLDEGEYHLTEVLETENEKLLKEATLLTEEESVGGTAYESAELATEGMEANHFLPILSESQETELLEERVLIYQNLDRIQRLHHRLHVLLEELEQNSPKKK